jgi:hypothetical protein
MFATAKHIVFEPKGNVSVEDLQQALKAWKVK